MKPKNAFGAVIGSLLATSSLNALAQGQGAVEMDVFAKYYEPDTRTGLDEGALYGAGIGYFLTDDVSLNLSHGLYDGVDVDGAAAGSKNIEGELTSLDAVYHFGAPDVGLRPYVSVGAAHQSIGQATSSGRDSSTFANLGTGVKYYFTQNVFAKAGVEAMYNIDQDNGEWMGGVGVGLNFGGGQPAPAPAPVAAVEPMPEPAPEPVMEAVRVELDVKFDFDKDRVKEESYGDVKNLADFMNQYPQTTTTVEGHTDSVGTDDYNQGLSERRANAVRDVLVNQYGVSGERVNAAGYGESQPVADNATDAGRAINRRVEAEVETQIQQ